MAKVNLKLEAWQAQLVLTELARRLGEEERTTTWRRFYTDRLLLTMNEIADQLLPTQIVIEGPLRAELYRLLLTLRRPFIGIYGTISSLAERLVKRKLP